MDKRPEIDAGYALETLISARDHALDKQWSSILAYAISCIQQVRDMKKKPVVDHDGGVML